VARELTKKFEEIVRGFLSEIVRHFEKTSPRGEAVILVAGAGEAGSSPQHGENEETAEGRLKEAVTLARSLRSAGTSTRSAAMRAAEDLKVPWREVYRALLAR
jgi:16S rRNA (cytidine1402-2'-O)-methyltransferase